MPVNPVDYSLNIPSPYDAFTQGAERAKQEQQAIREQTRQADFAKLVTNPKAQMQDYNDLIVKYPEFMQQIQSSWKAMSDSRRQAEADLGSKIVFALENGQPDIAKKVLMQNAEAYRNSGRMEEAKQAETMVNMIDINPDFVKTSAKLSLMAGMGAEKYAELEAKKAEAQAGGQEPAAWREWTNFQKLSPEEQKRYLSLKRQEQVKDVGGGYGVYNPVTGEMTSVSGSVKGLTPAQQAAEERKSRETEYKFKNDQNLLNNALSENQKQIQLIESLFNPNGTLNNAVAKNFGLFQVTSKIPGTEATDAKAVLKLLNARAFVGQLGEMKNQSQTGASGLGSLAVSEGNKVQEAAAALQSEQSAESFAKNVRLYQKELKDANDRLIKGFQNIYQNKISAPTPTGTQTPAGGAGGAKMFEVPY